LLAALAVGGCGASRHATATVETKPRPASQPGYHVGVVGPLTLGVEGVRATHGPLAKVADEPLVVVDARVADAQAVAAVARAHPDSQFAIVGASARAEHVPNLTGIVLKEGDAAYLAGVAAGLAAEEGGGQRVAWVGPQERPLAAAFTRGVHAAARGVTVLRQWTRSVPARCKEAALTSFDRGAVVVMAHGGLCAAAAADAAHDQNLPALSLDDFLLRSVAAARVARDASAGVFHGGQDVIFGTSTGAVGVRTLDPRISLATAARVRAAAQAFAGAAGQGG
jgi:basic membrane lipoprotein Med (substrate-binding protein (PBP1-ABC) superfamily)